MSRIVFTTLGLAVVGFALSQMFLDLFHPTESGSLSSFLGRTIFRTFRKRLQLLPWAGPLALVLVIVSWTISLGFGFALLYTPDFPIGFQFGLEAHPEKEHGLGPALYYSLAVLSTLGAGNVTPNTPWLRALVPLEALVGIALITASVSWIVLLYPALARSRCLARRTSILSKAETATGVDVVSGEAQYVLGQLSEAVIRARVDYIHFPLIYYFYSGDKHASLAYAIPKLQGFAEMGARPDSPERVRLASAALRNALDDLAEVLSDMFVDVDKKEPDAVFRAFAKDHVVP